MKFRSPSFFCRLGIDPVNLLNCIVYVPSFKVNPVEWNAFFEVERHRFCSIDNLDLSLEIIQRKILDPALY